MNDCPVLELVLCPLKDGPDEQAFLRAADATTRDLQTLSGFVSRRLFKSEDGRWADLVCWSGIAEAERAAETFLSLPNAASFVGMLDESSITMLHLTPQRAHSAAAGPG